MMRPIHTTSPSLLLSTALLLFTAPLAAQTDWSTYFGRGGDDWLLDLQTDAAGRVYVCGRTEGAAHVTPNALQPTSAGGADAWVACLDPRLPPAQQLVWGTHLGGSGDESALELHVDDLGTLVTVIGYTTSGDFPVTTGVGHAGGQDAFITVLAPGGAGAGQLVWSTLIGGANDDVASSVDIRGGRIGVVGTTESTDLPVLAAAQATAGGQRDLFIAHLLPGGAPSFVTYLGGTGDEARDAWNGPAEFRYKRARIVLDDQARSTIGGTTWSTNYPIVNGRVHGRRGNRDIVVSKLDASGQLIYSSILGGTGSDSLFDLRANGSDRVVLAGASGSVNFPVTPDRYSLFRGNVDAVVVHLDVAQDTLLYSTFLGDREQEFALTAYLEPSGTFVVAGHSFSSGFPITAGAPQTVRGVPTPNVQSYLARLRPGAPATGLQYATWFGGNNQQSVLAIESDGRGGVVAAGPTVSSVFPTTSNAFDTTFDGPRDGWIAVHHMLPSGVQRLGRATSPCGASTFLQMNSAPLPGNANWALETHGAPPASLGAVFVAAPNPGGLNLLGVDLFVNLPAFAGLTLSADQNGFANLPLPLPAGFSWDGSVAFQSVWLNPSPCAGQPLSASNAVR